MLASRSCAVTLPDAEPTPPWLFNATTAELLAYAESWAARPRKGVPQVLHQSWKSCQLPKLQSRLRARCARLLGDAWRLPLWSDADNDRLVQRAFGPFHASFRSYSLPIKRADAARYMYIFAFGGVYMDTDSTCLRDLSRLRLDGSEALVSYQRRGGLGGPDAVAVSRVAAA